VAVLRRLFVSPGFVERMPPKNARSEPSGIRSRSGCDIADQPPIATESPPTPPLGLISRWMRSSLFPFRRVNTTWSTPSDVRARPGSAKLMTVPGSRVH
jgi:hypothetical protein